MSWERQSTASNVGEIDPQTQKHEASEREKACEIVATSSRMDRVLYTTPRLTEHIRFPQGDVAPSS